jgi:hypothetical protein
MLQPGQDSHFQINVKMEIFQLIVSLIFGILSGIFHLFKANFLELFLYCSLKGGFHGRLYVVYVLMSIFSAIFLLPDLCMIRGKNGVTVSGYCL